MKEEVFEKGKHYKFYFDKMELTERLGKGWLYSFFDECGITKVIDDNTAIIEHDILPNIKVERKWCEEKDD